MVYFKECFFCFGTERKGTHQRPRRAILTWRSRQTLFYLEKTKFALPDNIREMQHLKYYYLLCLLTTGPGMPRRPSGPGFPAGPCGPTGPVFPGAPSAPGSPQKDHKQQVREAELTQLGTVGLYKLQSESRVSSLHFFKNYCKTILHRTLFCSKVLIASYKDVDPAKACSSAFPQGRVELGCHRRESTMCSIMYCY